MKKRTIVAYRRVRYGEVHVDGLTFVDLESAKRFAERAKIAIVVRDWETPKVQHK